ncbi:MAG TPA: FAD-dependent oxidoreductase, partial [Acidimicrobiales bacterium]|nr:FAD-dependent oxidoreductase [Acidimicrobiales bacterium]
MAHVVVIGGGPAGNQAASRAASLGARVTVIEKEVVGGAAHLWDCIPSKAMIATAGALGFSRRMKGLGVSLPAGELGAEAAVDEPNLARRIAEVTTRLQRGTEELLVSQGVRVLRGEGRLLGPHHVAATAASGVREVLEADTVLLSTGSRPRVPEWAQPDGERILTTRQAYPPPEMPEHLVVVGSGVT